MLRNDPNSARKNRNRGVVQNCHIVRSRSSADLEEPDSASEPEPDSAKRDPIRGQRMAGERRAGGHMRHTHTHTRWVSLFESSSTLN
jgi:hypothetical protein